MNQTMRNIKEFWAWCVGSDRRSGHEPAESSNSALDLKHEADVPPAYSARPLGFNEPRMHPNSAILETGSALVHKLGGAWQAVRATVSEWNPERGKARVEQLLDALRLCMVQDYWSPPSSSTTESEALSTNWATAWGLNYTGVSTSWRHLLNDLWVDWEEERWRVDGFSIEGMARIHMPARTLGLDSLVIWTRVGEFSEKDLLLVMTDLLDADRVDGAPPKWRYIEHLIQHGLWRWAASKIHHDRAKGLEILLTSKEFPDGIECYRQVYDILRASIKQVEKKCFDRLVSRDDFTLSEFALDLCGPVDTYSSCSLLVQRTLAAHEKKKRRRERIGRGSSGGTVNQRGSVCPTCGVARKESPLMQAGLAQHTEEDQT